MTRVLTKFRDRRVAVILLLVVAMGLAGIPTLHSALATTNYEEDRVVIEESTHTTVLPSGWSGLGFSVSKGDVITVSFETVNATFDVVLRFGPSLAHNRDSEYPLSVTNVTRGSAEFTAPRDGVLEFTWRPYWSPNQGFTLESVEVKFRYHLRVMPNPTGLSVLPFLS